MKLFICVFKDFRLQQEPTGSLRKLQENKRNVIHYTCYPAAVYIFRGEDRCLLPVWNDKMFAFGETNHRLFHCPAYAEHRAQVVAHTAQFV